MVYPQNDLKFTRELSFFGGALITFMASWSERYLANFIDFNSRTTPRSPIFVDSKSFNFAANIEKYSQHTIKPWINDHKNAGSCTHNKKFMQKVKP